MLASQSLDTLYISVKIFFMKVIQFVPTLESGGVEQGVIEISKALVDAGHDSHVVSAGGRLVDQLINEGTHHHHWKLHKKNIFTLRHVRPLARWIEEMKADILHVRSRMPAWIVWKALNKIPIHKRPKLVSTIHGLYSVNFYSAVMSKPQNIITVSNSAYSYLIDNYIKTDSKNITDFKLSFSVSTYGERNEKRSYEDSLEYTGKTEDGYYTFEYLDENGEKIPVVVPSTDEEKASSQYTERTKKRNTDVTLTRRKYSDDYDPSIPYIERPDRPKEWVLIGLLGQVPVNANTVIPSHWKKLKNLESGVDFYYIYNK